MMIKQKIEEWIKKETDFSGEIILVHPKELENGDFTWIVNDGNAKKYFETLNQKIISEVSEIKFVEPRFINFFLSKKFFEEEISGIGDEYGKNDSLAGQKIMIEYTNTNVLKPLHVGHLLGNILGQSLSNILENCGAEIKRVTYQGDVGLHVAKALWGIQQKGGIISGSLEEKIKYIGEAYTLGAQKYDDDETAQSQIKEINQKLFENSDKEIEKIYKWAREISLEHFESLYKKLNTKFDYYFFESEVEKKSLNIVHDYLKKGIFEESQGAIVFKGEKYDPKLHTRVFVSSLGIPMYEAKDIAHAIRKEEKWDSLKSLIITANEQDEYFKVVLKALEQINPIVAKKTSHLSHGILRLPDGKMSSRKGNIISGESLIEETKATVIEKLNYRDYSENEKNEISEMVAVAAVKYSILRQKIGSDIIFDFEKSVSFEGDSGPYLQYTAVRARSVLEKANYTTPKKPRGTLDTARPEEFEVIELERSMYKFPEVIERSSREFEPHYLVTYLTELASIFNTFYGKEKIIDENDLSSPYKLVLTSKFAKVMKSGLHLLGMKVPEKM